MSEEKKNVYLTFHKNFVRQDIEYADKNTGQTKTFNSVTLPKGTIINGTDVSYYQFSPLFVNESKYRGENYRDVPLLANREVWLQRSVLDENGEPVLAENGKPMRDVVKVFPQQLKDSLDESRRQYAKEHGSQEGRDGQSLSARAVNAREGAAALADHDIPFDSHER